MKVSKKKLQEINRLPFPDEIMKKPRDLICSDCRDELKINLKEFKKITRQYFQLKKDKQKELIYAG